MLQFSILEANVQIRLILHNEVFKLVMTLPVSPHAKQSRLSLGQQSPMFWLAANFFTVIPLVFSDTLTDYYAGITSTVYINKEFQGVSVRHPY